MRRLAIALLDDDYGIPDVAWQFLAELLSNEPGNEDILSAVDCQDGRWYLKHDVIK